MKVSNQRSGFTALLALAFALLLCVAFMLAFIPNNTPVHANESISATTCQIDLVKDKKIDISLTKSQSSFVKYACGYEGNHIISVSNSAVKVVRIENQNSNEDVGFKALSQNTYIVSYQYGFNYLIELQSSVNQSTKIVINPEISAFDWIIGDEKISANQTVKLPRGNSYFVDFIVNDIESVSFSTGASDTYNYQMQDSFLVIDDTCPVEKNEIILVSNLPYISSQYLTLIPTFNNKIEIESSFDNGDARGLLWKYQNGITQITYQIEYANDVFTKTIDTIDEEPISSFEHGQVYELDVADDLLAMTDTLCKAKVSITSVTMFDTGSKAVDFDVEGSSAIVNTRLSWVGSGTSSSPYQVSSVSHFNDISSKDGSSVYFKQTVNLLYFMSVPTRNVHFRGIYDGNGKNISVIDSNPAGALPLHFGGMFDRNSGTIRNLNNVFMYLSFDFFGFVGGMVGRNTGEIHVPNNYNTNLIVNCVSPSIYVYVGGVAGFNSGTIILVEDVTDIRIESNGTIGGIAGQNYQGSIYSNNPISEPYKTVNGRIKWTYLEDTPASLWNIGGIVGINSHPSNAPFNTSIMVCSIDFTLTAPNNSNIKPRAGANLGRHDSGPIDTDNFQFIGGSYTLNLTPAQQLYVDFQGNNPYINTNYVGQSLS